MSVRVEMYKMVGRNFLVRFSEKISICLKTAVVCAGVVFEEIQF